MRTCITRTHGLFFPLSALRTQWLPTMNFGVTQHCQSHKPDKRLGRWSIQALCIISYNCWVVEIRLDHTSFVLGLTTFESLKGMRNVVEKNQFLLSEAETRV